MGATRLILLILPGFMSVLLAGCVSRSPSGHLSHDALSPRSASHASTIKLASHSATPNVALGAPIAQAQFGLPIANDQQSECTLQALIDIAGQHHPDLRWARARIETARGQFIQAGLYPNPIVGPRVTQIGHFENDWGEAGATFTQTIVTRNKLGIARAAAARGIEAADWQAVTKWNDVVTRVRIAYFEVLTVTREQDTLKNILRVSEDAVKTAESLEKAGAGNRPDVLRARVELEQNRLRLGVANRRADAAVEGLMIALGRPKTPIDNLLPRNGKELDRKAPEYDWNAMLQCVNERSSELQEARAAIVQQELLISKAQADVTPNIDVNLIPFYASYAKEMRGLVAVTMPVPIFDRNQGNILAAKGNHLRVLAEEQQVELRLSERLNVAFQRYRIALQQTQAYREAINPQARESLKLVEAGYRGGDKKYDYTAVLQAQQILFQAQLAEAQALGELWRSVSEIAGILQLSHFDDNCLKRP